MRHLELPLRRVPLHKRLWVTHVLLLDPRTSRVARDLWVDHSGVLAHLAEEVLAVDELKGPPPQRGEDESEQIELSIRSLGDDSHDIGVTQPSAIDEALTNAVPGSGSHRDEVHLRKGNELAVVQVNGKLEREKIPQRRKAPKDLDDLLQRTCASNSSWRAFAHHVFEQAKVVAVFARIAERRRRHYVCGRIHTLAARHHRIKNPGVSLVVELLPRNLA